MEKRLKNIEDGYKWAKETVQALRAGDLSKVDMDALIDEIESIYTGMEQQLSEYLEDVLKAKLRLDFIDNDDRESELLLIDALNELKSLLWAAPSVCEALTGDVIESAYANVRSRMTEVILPDRCPYSRERILNAVSELEFAAA